MGTLFLYYLSSFAGLVMVIGGIWLIYKEKIYIDRETKQVIQVETPVGKFKTNVPALALFVLGFVPLLYPLLRLPGPTVQLGGTFYVPGNQKVLIYACVEEETIYPTEDNRNDYRMNVPELVEGSGREYKAVIIAPGVTACAKPQPGASRGHEILMKEMKLSLPEKPVPAATSPLPIF